MSVNDDNRHTLTGNEVAHCLLDKLAGHDALSARQEAIVLTRGWIAHDLSGQMNAWRKFLRHFHKRRGVWK